MKKKLLIVTATAMLGLVACGAGNQDVIPSGGEKVENDVAVKKLGAAVTKTTTGKGLSVEAKSFALRAKVEMNTPSIDINTDIPNFSDFLAGSTATAQAGVKWETMSVNAEIKNVTFKAAVAGLDGRSSNDLKASLNFAETHSFNVNGAGSSIDSSATLKANAYVANTTAYLDLSDEATFNALKDLGMPLPFEAAGKYGVKGEAQTFDGPVGESMISSVPMVGQFLDEDYLEQLVSQSEGMVSAVKYSDTRFGVKAEMGLDKILPMMTAGAMGGMAEIGGGAAAIDMSMLDENDKFDLRAGMVFDTEKGLESIAFTLNAKLDVTAKEIFGAESGLDAKDLEKKVYSVDASADIRFEFKVGEVTVNLPANFNDYEVSKTQADDGREEEGGEINYSDLLA